MMYCEDGDMGKKIQLTKQKGKTLPESQILDWLIQIVMGWIFRHLLSTISTVRILFTETSNRRTFS